ncbi:MAG TPA: hypothetical protein VG034_05355 [Acidimicrobiia bacterium]|jgi:hypothetical protein|nr:hypothetical protein [Acidimicrobiia bacterium]
MSERIDVYLNDHFAGSAMALDLVERLQRETGDSPLGQFLAGLQPEIEKDQSTLMDIMSKLGIKPDPVKQLAGKAAEVISRVKLGGGDRESGRLLALETLSLGIEGKVCLWLSLARVADGYGALEGFDFGTLQGRAESQRKGVEEQRLTAVEETLGVHAPLPS